MAYERQKLKNELKINLNYGEINGKIKKKLKTFSGLSTDEAIATPEAVVRTAKVMYYDNIETA